VSDEQAEKAGQTEQHLPVEDRTKRSIAMSKILSGSSKSLFIVSPFSMPFAKSSRLFCNYLDLDALQITNSTRFENATRVVLVCLQKISRRIRPQLPRVTSFISDDLIASRASRPCRSQNSPTEFTFA
jgi:hypothetical protein